MKISKVIKHFQKYFFEIHNAIMHMHFWNDCSHPQKMALLKYFKHIEPCKEERIQSILPTLNGPLVCLMPSSAIEAANSAASEFLPMPGTIDEDSPTVCDKVIFKTVRGTYQEFKLVANCNKSPGVDSAMRQEFCHTLIVNFEQLSYYQKYPLEFQFCLIYSYSYIIICNPAIQLAS